MDWNRDGKTDFQDNAFFNCEISNDGGNSGECGGPGCLSVVLVVLIILQMVTWIVKVFD